MFFCGTQQAFFTLLQVLLEKLEFGQASDGFGNIDQHHLHIAQGVETIQLAFQAAAQLFDAWMRVKRANEFKRGQQAARGHAQIMDGCLCEFGAAGFQICAILFPAMVDEIR